MDFTYVRPETVSTASAAARAGDLVALASLVQGVEEGERGWEAVDNRGWGPLHHAAYTGQQECVQLLGQVECTDLDRCTWEGETPLLLACKNLPQSKEAVHALLKLNASVNLHTNEQCSPLQYAAVKADLDVVRWLVRKGARVNHTNVWGESALHTAMKKSGEETSDRIEIIRYLLKHEAKVICFDENQLTPLMLAAQKGFGKICEILLTHNNISYEKTSKHANLKAEDGATALMMAAQGGKLGCVQILLNLGADPNISAEDGTYAVHLACIARQNSREILELLLPLTGILNISEACNLKEPEYIPRYPDKKVLSPFQLAIEWENWDSLDVLVKYLDSRIFLTPLEHCFIHKDLCPDERGYCETYPHRLRNPLALLLSERISEKTMEKLPLFINNIREEHSIPPLVALLTSSLLDVYGDSFSKDQLVGKAFQLLLDNGASISDQDLLPVFLFSSVSGIFKLVQSGLIGPHQLVDRKYLDMTRQMLDRYFSQSMANQVFQPPLIAQRLLSCGIIATHCSLLHSGWVQCLATLVLDQLRSVFSIDSLVVIDKMYNNLKKPKALQELARNQIHKGLMLKPYQAMDKLNIPTQIMNYLLFHDVKADLMITDYKDTIEHINDNGVSNVVHV
eukprot:GFUD01025940.1.p1 GENE.GFUD01025940.1~~GFUD01025940.1.p1  ORF type:complete len:626 (-),score=184.20 GFUD01025940.1:37-1914(-)